MDEWQWLINASIGSVLAVLGWFARQMYDSMNKLKDDLNGLEVQLPKTYLTQSDFRYYTERSEEAQDKKHAEVCGRLDKIFDKLDTKQDK